MEIQKENKNNFNQSHLIVQNQLDLNYFKSSNLLPSN